MPKFKISERIKRPDFNPIGVREFNQNQAKEKLSGWLHSALTDNFMILFFALWFLPLAAITIFAIFSFGSLPDQIPLFYSRRWGEAQLAPKGYIFVPAIGSFLLGIFNFCLGINFHPKEKVLAYLLGGTAAVVALLAAITGGKIIILMS